MSQRWLALPPKVVGVGGDPYARGVDEPQVHGLASGRCLGARRSARRCLPGHLHRRPGRTRFSRPMRMPSTAASCSVRLKFRALARLAPGVEAADAGLATVRFPECGEDVDRRRRAGAVRSEQHEDLSAPHQQVDTFRDRGVLECLGQAFRLCGNVRHCPVSSQPEVVVRLGLRALSAPMGSGAGRQLRPSLAGRGRDVLWAVREMVLRHGWQSRQRVGGLLHWLGPGSPESVRGGGVFLPFICQHAELGRPRAAPAAERAGPVARPPDVLRGSAPETGRPRLRWDSGGRPARAALPVRRTDPSR